MAKLTEDQIIAVGNEWRHLENISYLETCLDSRVLFPYFNALKDHDVIEIGPGNNSINAHFPCKGYCAAYGSYPHDGLSLLRTKEDASAVVVSFGVIDDSILMPHRNPGLNLINLRYIEELVKEIKRITNPFSIIIGRDTQKYMGKPNISPIFEKYGGIYLRSAK